MKTLIIYKSTHRMNTERVAKAMASSINAKLAKVEEVSPEDLSMYDLIGFGSGIYASKLHRKIHKFIEKMPQTNKNVFIFCTSGSSTFDDKQIRVKLINKGCKVVGEFGCAGEFSFLGFTIDKKGHPDDEDLENAKTFAKGTCI